MAALLALAAAVGWGSSDYAAGVASRKSTAVSVVVLTHFASVLALLVVSIDARDVVSIAAGTGSSGRGVEIGLDLAGFRIAGSPSSLDLLWGAAAGLSGGMGALFLYRGLARGAMAVVAPITAAGAAAMPAVFGVATGESISPLGIAGLLLALVAIVMVSMSGGEAESVEAEAADTVGTVATVPVAVPVPRPFGTRRRRERQTLPHTVLPFLALCFVAAPYAGPRALNASAVSSPWFDGSALVLIGVVLGVFVLSTQLASATANGGAVAPRPGVAHRRHTVAAPARSKRGLAAPGVLDAIVSGAGFGCFYIVLARADEAAGNWPLVVARGLSVVLFGLAALLTKGPILPVKGSRLAVVVAGVLDAAAAVLFVAATRSGLLSISAVLSSMYPSVTVLLARVITKERITRLQLLGLAVAGIAIGMLAVF